MRDALSAHPVSYKFIAIINTRNSPMTMLLLVVTLIAMLGFAIVRHLQIQNGKSTLSSPHRPHRRR